jgi:hypothetical protein
MSKLLEELRKKRAAEGDTLEIEPMGNSPVTEEKGAEKSAPEDKTDTSMIEQILSGAGPAGKLLSIFAGPTIRETQGEAGGRWTLASCQRPTLPRLALLAHLVATAAQRLTL